MYTVHDCSQNIISGRKESRKIETGTKAVAERKGTAMHDMICGFQFYPVVIGSCGIFKD